MAQSPNVEMGAPVDHVVLIGPMGVGKTTCGEQLADRLGRLLLDSDAWIEDRYGRSGREIAAESGVDRLHAIELEVFADMARTGEGAVITVAESVVDSPVGRSLLDTHTTVWLTADADTLRRRRSEQDHRRPMSDTEMEERIAGRGPQLAAIARHSEETSDRTPTEIAASIEAALVDR